jgi:hypothetical protein
VSDKEPILRDTMVRIRNEKPVGEFATVTINGQIVPVYSATIELRAGEFNHVILDAIAKDIDIVALEQHTVLRVVDHRDTATDNAEHSA